MFGRFAGFDIGFDIGFDGGVVYKRRRSEGLYPQSQRPSRQRMEHGLIIKGGIHEAVFSHL